MIDTVNSCVMSESGFNNAINRDKLMARYSITI